MRGGYLYDKDKVGFRKEKISVWRIVRKVLLFLVTTVSMAILYYVIFALFFSTEQERVLKQQNRMYEKEYPVLEEKEKLLSEVVKGLEIRDDRIYEEIFHAPAPNMDPGSSLDYLIGIDSIPDRDIVKRSAGRLKALETKAGDIEENFRSVIAMLQDGETTVPPMSNPLAEFSFAQIGASVGERVNPFYKVKINHKGLDMIAPSGAPVYASADGVVSDVTKSRKGLGNVVTVNHGGGYSTRYAHLADIEVRKGRNVKKGTRLGYVGMSGNSFAPHLHYEVLKDTLVMDPVHYFFASVSPEEYVNMLIMSASTGQSMD